MGQVETCPIQINRGQLNAETRRPAPGRLKRSRSSPSGDPKRAHQTGRNRPGGCGVERLSITRFALYTQARLAFVDSTHGLS